MSQYSLTVVVTHSLAPLASVPLSSVCWDFLPPSRLWMASYASNLSFLISLCTEAGISGTRKAKMLDITNIICYMKRDIIVVSYIAMINYSGVASTWASHHQGSACCMVFCFRTGYTQYSQFYAG